MFRAPFITLGLFACSLTLVVAGCERAPAQGAAPPSMPPPAVSVAEAVSQDVPIYLDAIGRIVATESVSVVPQVEGKVIAAHVEDGAYVKKGDVLFEIDKRQYDAELATAIATHAQHNAELGWAQSDFKRTEELFRTNVASQLEYDQKKSQLGVMQAKIDAAKASIDSAKLKLEYTKIVAPLDGRAGARLVDEGNIVKENEGMMLMIQRVTPIYAEFTVTENDLGTVRKYMASRGMAIGREESLGLVTLVDVPANSERITSVLGNPSTRPSKLFDEPHEGKLTFLDNTIQSATGTVRLRATLPNANLFFWPGQFVNVRLILTTKKDAVLIPTQAQQIGQQGSFVYVVKPGEIEDPQTKQKHPAEVAELRAITTGQRQGDKLVVESGVKSGEKVIIAGHMTVVPGGPVRVTNAPPAAATGTAQAQR